MGDCISLYPMYNGDTSDGVFVLKPYKLSFLDEDGNKHNLRLQADYVRSYLFFVDDPDDVWIHENYGFLVDRKIHISDPSSLFGSGSNAVACHDATLGLAFQWSSKSSSRKATKKIGSFTAKDRALELDISEKFEKCALRGEVNFSVILYIEKPGIPTDDESLFINQAGYVLGEIEGITLQLDGNGSMLPVFYEDVRGGALWRVSCNFSDPSYDSFSNPDVVSITINRSNPNFKFIDKKNEAYNPQMANEVMASAITMIIESLRVYDNFASLDNPESGSVSDAVRYFRDVLSWDMSTPIAVNNSIREAFEKKKQES